MNRRAMRKIYINIAKHVNIYIRLTFAGVDQHLLVDWSSGIFRTMYCEGIKLDGVSNMTPMEVVNIGWNLKTFILKRNKKIFEEKNQHLRIKLEMQLSDSGGWY